MKRQIITPNLFNFATKELSQDAFLAWYFSWADSEYKNADSELYKSAITFLCKYVGDVAIKSVDVRMQWQHIDILLTINKGSDDECIVIIEDKTFTSIHDNQLNKYDESVKSYIGKEHGKKIIKLYIKSSIESLAITDKIINDGYIPIYIDDLYNGIKNCKSSNPIFVDYLDHLTSLKNKFESTVHNAQFDNYQVQYFFLKVEEELRKGGIAVAWNMVGNRAQSKYVLYGFNKVICVNNKKFDTYIEISLDNKNQLCGCVRLAGDVYSNIVEAADRNVYYEMLNKDYFEKANGKKGKTSAVASIKNGLLVPDVSKIVPNLLQISQLL